jgi:hypothetical protein
MIDLNRRAFTDIQHERYDAAKYWLEEALVISETASLEHDEMTARTHVHLAVVALSGNNNRSEAVNQLSLALKINPNITITTGLETPILKAAYLEARENLGLPPNPDPTAITKTHEIKPLPPEDATRDTSSSSEESGAPNVLDPDPPVRVPTPLHCQVPFEVPADKDLLVRCLTQKHQKRASATLYYRQDGAAVSQYTALPMSRSPKGWLIAIIPADDITGKSLSYYVKAQLPGSQLSLYSGYPETPTAVLVKTASPSRRPGDDAAAAGGPNANGGGKRWNRRAPGSVWLGLGAGTGTVYHGSTPVDSNTRVTFTTDPVYVESGFSSGGLLQIEPELGYQLSERISLSALLRYQYAPKDPDGDKPAVGERPVLTSALAGFARAQITLGSSGNLQPYLSVGGGFGTSFLAVVAKRCDPGACGLDHSDTIHGGALGALVGAGLLYHITPRFSLALDLKEIVTMPKVMAMTEVNVGVQASHDFAGRGPINQAKRSSPLAHP